MKLLIVEDEPKTLSFLKKGMAEHGYVVDVAVNGEDGAHLALTGAYDFIILDVMLPRRDGWQVLRDLRQAGKQTPVLMLTAMDAVDDKVKGLELGADDYLVKPFAFSELLARVRTIVRRGSGRQADALALGGLEMDVLRQKVSRDGKRLDLTRQEFRLLELFMRRPGEVLSRTLIAEQVWDIHFDSDTNVVDVAVRRLRTRIDEPFERKLIHTVRGVGYILEERD